MTRSEPTGGSEDLRDGGETEKEPTTIAKMPVYFSVEGKTDQRNGPGSAGKGSNKPLKVGWKRAKKLGTVPGRDWGGEW